VADATPPEIVENWTLLDGSAATLRSIRGSDMELERAFVRNLSPQSKFKRFMGELKELSPEQLFAFTHPDHARESAYVVIRSTVAGEEEIAVARYILAPDNESCEFAITIADAWQGKGVAGRLMRALIRDARTRGLKRMDGFVLGANTRMLDFVRKLGFKIEFDPDDPAVRLARLDLQAGAPAGSR
jgi:acetyltransferase